MVKRKDILSTLNAEEELAKVISQIEREFDAWAQESARKKGDKFTKKYNLTPHPQASVRVTEAFKEGGWSAKVSSLDAADVSQSGATHQVEIVLE
ncbi:MAG: hypothetical protein V4526_00510 [Patescibacteria group bacterium]